jgi:hypothetical protein
MPTATGHHATVTQMAESNILFRSAITAHIHMTMTVTTLTWRFGENNQTPESRTRLE